MWAVVCGAPNVLLLQIYSKDSEPSGNFNKICLYFHSFFYFHSPLDKDLAGLHGLKCHRAIFKDGCV